MAIYQGIDSGNTQLRKVTIKTGFSGFAGVAKGKPGRKVLVLPANLLTFRELNFPFQDKKRIMDILPGELMETIALPLDEMLWNVTSIQKNKAAVVLTVREELDKFTKSQENSVKIIDAEPCALTRTANYNNVKDALIIDLGASRTTFTGIKEGKLDMLRVRMMGGSRIDRILAEEKNISTEEAEQIKMTEGLHNKSVKRFLDALFDSVSLPPTQEYEKVILTGGGAQMPGLVDYIKERLEMTPEYFQLPGGLSPFYDAVAFGAAMYETGKADKINFKKEQDQNGKKSVFWLLLLLIPIILLSMSLKLKENQLAKENYLMKKAMLKAVQKEFPGSKSVKAPLSYVRSKMKKESGDTGEPSRKVIPMLNDVALSGKRLTISYYEMDITDKDFKIKGEADSFGTVEKFRVELAKKFDSAEILNQKTKADEKVDFAIRLTTVKKKDSKKDAKKEEAKPNDG